ncbi:MAG: formyltransferase family protein [Microcystis sp. LE17-20A]|nr:MULTISPECIES: formyltransferase family protein [unclassified Microcystis]MCZ8036835.1 formyltransferase family protein [Microcystis sp. LE17-20A]MCZ8212385.1 formyltransferase family protein [Microcystis sp. LE19-8.1F]
MKKVDLYLGGDLGLWVLDRVSQHEVEQIFTVDVSIARYAIMKGFNLCDKNVNTLEINSSDFGVSVHYPIIIQSHILVKYKKIYNLHPAFLPYGRGYYPIFWALWENTPAGATLHEINEKIDQGNIIERMQVEYDDIDTGGSLFKRVREAEKKLFERYWYKIVNEETLPSFPQLELGTYHSKKEFFYIKTQSNWQDMRGKDLIKLIRCLTFEGYTGLEIELGTKPFEVLLRALPE